MGGRRRCAPRGADLCSCDAEGTADGTAEASATRLASLPAAQFPNILAVVPAIGRVPTGEQYEYGIKRLLKGIEADVP